MAVMQYDTLATLLALAEHARHPGTSLATPLASPE